MRRANDSAFLVNEGALIGLNLGADFTSEHEWGINGIKRLFGIPSGDKDFGLTRRKITTVPQSPVFGWTKGKMPKSEGFYLYDSYRNEVPDFSNYSELHSWDDKIACAWDENSFGVFATDPKEIAYLKEIFMAFQSGDGAIFLGGDGIWRNSRLCLVISSRIPQEFLDGWYKDDKERYEMDQVVEKTGIRQLLKEKGKHYFALSRPHYRKSDGKLVLWLNPQEQHDNNYGYFTIDDLKEWADGKGKIPKAKEKKK